MNDTLKVKKFNQTSRTPDLSYQNTISYQHASNRIDYTPDTIGVFNVTNNHGGSLPPSNTTKL
jgi:hypothetical protein